MKILIVDDHSLFADSLEIMLSKHMDGSELITVKSVKEAEDALRATADALPDLAILDFKMPEMNGIDGMKHLRTIYPSLRIGIMSGQATRDEVHHCMTAGAVAFFPKTLSGPSLVSAIQLVLTGETFVPTNEAAHAGYRFNAQERSVAANNMPGRDVYLTKREKETLQYLLKGAANKEIARGMDISVVTVKLHVRNLCQKLNVNNRTQAALRATELGLVTEQDLRS